MSIYQTPQISAKIIDFGRRSKLCRGLLRPITLGLPSYINVHPLVCHLTAMSSFTLIRDYPTQINAQFRAKQLDGALISSVESFHFPPVMLPYGIAAKGEVASVNLYTKYPLEQLHQKTIAVTSQSATSTALLKVLAKNHWKISVRLEKLDDVYHLVDHDAFLLIGDQALVQAAPPGYILIDLSQAWYEMTALPFVFATLCTYKQELVEPIAGVFGDAIDNPRFKEKAIEELSTKWQYTTLAHYFSHLYYHLGSDELKALDTFRTLYDELAR